MWKLSTSTCISRRSHDDDDEEEDDDDDDDNDEDEDDAEDDDEDEQEEKDEDAIGKEDCNCLETRRIPIAGPCRDVARDTQRVVSRMVYRSRFFRSRRVYEFADSARARSGGELGGRGQSEGGRRVGCKRRAMPIPHRLLQLTRGICM